MVTRDVNAQNDLICEKLLGWERIEGPREEVIGMPVMGLQFPAPVPVPARWALPTPGMPDAFYPGMLEAFFPIPEFRYTPDFTDAVSTSLITEAFLKRGLFVQLRGEAKEWFCFVGDAKGGGFYGFASTMFEALRQAALKWLEHQA